MRGIFLCGRVDFHRLLSTRVKVVKAHYSTPADDLPRATKQPGDPEQFAIVGGGVSGLATAFFLSQARPKARITLFEASDRLGGWIESPLVQVNGGHVRFEKGPHTLRPNSGPRDDLVLDLVSDFAHCRLQILMITDWPVGAGRRGDCNVQRQSGGPKPICLLPRPARQSTRTGGFSSRSPEADSRATLRRCFSRHP